MNLEDRRNIVLRLTALWAMLESGLGGVLHLFQLPFSGVILTGFSICILCLIYHFSEGKMRPMTESLILVLLIKYSISPHTSPTAAIAVGFQCLFSYIIYSLFSISWIAILFVSVITFLESAFQKIFVLYFIYGKELPKIIDDFVAKVSMQWMNIEGFTSAQSILLYYTSVYLVGAFLASFLVYKLYVKLVYADHNLFSNLSLTDLHEVNNQVEFEKKKSMRYIGLFFLLFFIPIISIIAGYKHVVYIFLRSIVMILIWIFIILPIVNYWLQSFLHKKKEKYQFKLNELRSIFPRINAAFYWAIEQSKSQTWNKKFFQIPYYIIGFTLFAKE